MHFKAYPRRHSSGRASGDSVADGRREAKEDPLLLKDGSVFRL